MPVMIQPKAPSFSFKRNCSLRHIDATCLKTLKTMHLVPMQLEGLVLHNRNWIKRKQMCELSLSHPSKMQARHPTRAKQISRRLLKLAKNKMVTKCLPRTRLWTSLPSFRLLPKAVSRLTTLTKLTRMHTLLTHTLWAWSTAIFSQSVMATDQMVAMWVRFWSTDFHFSSKAIFSINLLSTIWCITLHWAKCTLHWSMRSNRQITRFATWGSTSGSVAQHASVCSPMAATCSWAMSETQEP